jgi:hypothetical protein
MATEKSWISFCLDDSGGAPRELPVDTINGVGLDYPEVDLIVSQDAIRDALPDGAITVMFAPAANK